MRPMFRWQFLPSRCSTPAAHIAPQRLWYPSCPVPPRRIVCRGATAYDATSVTSSLGDEVKMFQGQAALYIGATWPEPCSTAAGLRSWSILNILKVAGYEVHCAASSRLCDATEEVQRRGIHTIEQHPNDPAFDEYLQQLQPRIVIFDRFTTEEKFGWRVDEHAPTALKVLDTQDIHFLRAAREQAVQSACSLEEIVNVKLLPASELLLRELSSIYRSDLTLIISDYELKLLQQQFKVPAPLLHLQRFSYAPPDLSTNPPYDARSGFATIGNFRHKPNVDGVKWLRSEVWPLVRKALPDANIYIYGAYPTAEIMKMSSSADGFHVAGPVKDQYQCLRKHRVNLAALRFGAGIKGKVTDGWWCGTPCVATQIGAEGMVDDLPFGGAVAGSAESFADMCVTLYTQQQDWTQTQQHGYQLLNRLYDAELNAHTLLRGLKEALDNQEDNRMNNFVGGMLRYNKHRSTMYFSRWIEAKNLAKNRHNSNLNVPDV